MDDKKYSESSIIKMSSDEREEEIRALEDEREELTRKIEDVMREYANLSGAMRYKPRKRKR